MEKIGSTFTFLLALAIASHAQNKTVRAGLVNGQLTISPSLSFAQKQSLFYLHGSIDGYASEKISVSGEGYLSIATANSIFNYNHSLFAGFSRHFVKNTSDWYVGMQPGLAFTKLDEKNNNLPSTTNGVNPLFSTVAGCNVYISSLFHLFLQARVVLGQHVYDANKNLSELRFSVGLGFHQNLK